MNKRSLLWMYAFLLLLAGCSNDDDSNAVMNKYIWGYWERVKGYTISPGGLIFTPDGEIKSWGYYDDNTPNTYSEAHWGYYWFDDKGELEIKWGSQDVYPDELYYKAMSLTKDRLVIRIFGGIAGTPLEKGYDVEYKKIEVAK